MVGGTKDRQMTVRDAILGLMINPLREVATIVNKVTGRNDNDTSKESNRK
jgi:hypothetical protein